MKNVLLSALIACFATVACLFSAEYQPPPTSDAARLRAWSKMSTSAKQDALTNTSSVTVSNITATGVQAFNSQNLASAQKPVFNYGSGTAYGTLSDASQTNSTGANVALYGSSGGQANWNIGGVGVVYGTTAGTTNSGLYGAAATYGASAIFNAIVGELVNDESAVPELVQETSVLLLDNRNTAAPLIIARDNGVTKFRVNTNGSVVLAGTTNQVTFGATNTAPAVTTNVAKWISVQVGSFTNAYRIPLFE